MMDFGGVGRVGTGGMVAVVALVAFLVVVVFALPLAVWRWRWRRRWQCRGRLLFEQHLAAPAVVDADELRGDLLGGGFAADVALLAALLGQTAATAYRRLQPLPGAFTVCRPTTATSHQLPTCIRPAFQRPIRSLFHTCLYGTDDRTRVASRSLAVQFVGSHIPADGQAAQINTQLSEQAQNYVQQLQSQWASHLWVNCCYARTSPQ